jgi:hypothetical protein
MMGPHLLPLLRLRARCTLPPEPGILRANGLSDVSGDGINLVSSDNLKLKGPGPASLNLVCLHYSYYLHPILTWHGIDFQVVEWCDTWAHA